MYEFQTLHLAYFISAIKVGDKNSVQKLIANVFSFVKKHRKLFTVLNISEVLYNSCLFPPDTLGAVWTF